MKKSLIALAVLAASGAAMAQSSVQVYGVADIWFGTTKSDGLRQTVLESGGISGSRIGFKGTEDLGGGLKANFVLEQGFNLDNGAQGDSAAGAFNRQATVGLEGGFGAVSLGRNYTAYDSVRGVNNNTFDSALTALPWLGYAGRANNQIRYDSPVFSGFQAGVSYGLGENKTPTTSAGKTVALNLTYTAGPLMVGYGYQSETAGGTTPTLLSLFADLGEVSGVAGDKANYNILTGSYDLGVAKLLASYNTAKASRIGVADDFKAKEYQLGVEVPLSSNLTLAVGYGNGKGETAGVEEYKARAFSAALSYTLSKRTSVYTGFNNTKVTPAGEAAEKSSTYALGIRHAF